MKPTGILVATLALMTLGRVEIWKDDPTYSQHLQTVAPGAAHPGSVPSSTTIRIVPVSTSYR